ncbi:MAG: hypothetical protein PVG14_10545, partial [Anaerolineales bacterium]
MKKLDNLKWVPAWVSHMGCLKGCLNYLGLDITDGWLYGGTGHAFVINIHESVCPSGPTAWNTEMLIELGRNLGYETDGIFGAQGMEGDFTELQRRAWEFTRQAINAGLPVYGWELEIPEFYVVHGYDEIGYYYSGVGADDGKGPKPWSELGITGIGMVELYRLKPAEAQEDAVVVHSVFKRVLQHAANPKEWIFDNYASGLKSFDLWIEALESGKADRFGMGYNAEVWRECRSQAVSFLKEAKQRLNGAAGAWFDEGSEHYQVVAERLNEVAEIYPFDAASDGQVIARDENSRSAVK